MGPKYVVKFPIVLENSRPGSVGSTFTDLDLQVHTKKSLEMGFEVLQGFLLKKVVSVL